MTAAPMNFRMAATVTDSDVIAAMAASVDPLCRLGAAANRECPAGILQVLVHDSVNAIRLQALVHPNCPPSTIAAARPDLDDLLASVMETISAADEDIRRTWATAVDAIARG